LVSPAIATCRRAIWLAPAALFPGAWKLHQSKMATRELIWQYKNQLGHFSRSSAELERTVAARGHSR
jgi:hypothetical protein